MRFIIVFLALCRIAIADGFFSLGGGASGPPTGPDLTNVGLFIGSGNPANSNGLATSLVASGTVNGTITFPSDAIAGDYTPPGVSVTLFSPLNGSGFVVRNTLGVPIAEVAFNVDGTGPTWQFSGAPQLEIPISSSDGQTDIPTAITALRDAYNGTFGTNGSANIAEDGVTLHIELTGYQDATAPTVNGNMSADVFRHGGPGTATRNAAVATLLSRGWTVNNAK